MIILRLLGAAICLQSAAASETLSLRRSIDPELVVDDLTNAALIADYDELYKTLKGDYIKEGCVQKWGEFPSPTFTTFDHPSMVELKNNLKGGMICNCGILYDLGLSAMMREDNNTNKNEEDVAFAAIEDFVGIDSAAREIANPMTQLDAWAMARTSNGQAKCVDGSAAGYPCNNVDLIAHLPLNSFRTTNSNQAPLMANDVWGWTNTDGREFVIFGVREGMYFLEVKAATSSDPLVLLGYLPSASGYTLQHDMKVIGDYAYIGAESESHGMQIFDMRRLLTINPDTDCENYLYCLKLSHDRLYTGSSNFRVENSHNIVVNEETKYVYIVGSKSCNGGLHIVDVRNPLNPTRVACYKEGGYVHDAQCVKYKGPDPKYQLKEICFCYNENSVKIVDVSDKNNIQMLSSTSYNAVDYTHQGWLSSDHRYIVFGDEGDEYFNMVQKTRTLVLHVGNLENPNPSVREFYGTTPAADHNQYIIKAKANGQDYTSDSDLVYQANYEAGMRILEVIDYETANFKEIGYFDTYPKNNEAKFMGAWSVYPYFESGMVAISSLNEGLFLVKPKLHSNLGQSNVVVEIECKDEQVAHLYRNKIKDCNWVSKPKQGNAKATRKRTRRRCKRKHEGDLRLHKWCKETCGNVGIGGCKATNTKIKLKRENSNAQSK